MIGLGLRLDDAAGTLCGASQFLAWESLVTPMKKPERYPERREPAP